jgi:DNA-binding response OmpR family regulator
MTKILIIEDDDEVRNLVKRVLIKEGHEIFEAADGVLGVSVFRKTDPDIVISDIVMPNQDGFETIEEILTIEPNTKIIVISGGGTRSPERHFKHAKDIGAIKTLAKPFTPPDLVKVVEEVL